MMFARLDARHPRGQGALHPPRQESTTMSKASFVPVWEMMRLRHGIGLRCIQAIPADKLDARPIKDMRTPKELVVHMYSFLRAAPESVLAGSLTVDEDAVLARIKSRTDLASYANDCWKA